MDEIIKEIETLTEKCKNELEPGREVSLAVTKLQEAKLWLKLLAGRVN